MTVRVRITCDTSEVDADLRRIADGPDRRHHRIFDGILTRQFQETQMVVHVITGSLRASGKHDSRSRRNGGWEGEISYGGALVRAAQPGPANNPVRYAKYEYRKPFDERYDHNYFRPILKDDDYGDAIADWMGKRT